jgi:hypothetical protein
MYRKRRTHDRTRRKTSRPKITLATGEPSTHDEFGKRFEFFSSLLTLKQPEGR